MPPDAACLLSLMEAISTLYLYSSWTIGNIYSGLLHEFVSIGDLTLQAVTLTSCHWLALLSSMVTFALTAELEAKSSEAGNEQASLL